HDDQNVGGHEIRSERGEERGHHGQRQTDIGHEAEQSAQRSHEKGIGNLDEIKHRRTDDGHQKSQQEVAHDKPAHHFGDALQAARGYSAGLALEKLQEAAVDVVAPTQHEIHQKGNKGDHQQNVIEGIQV